MGIVKPSTETDTKNQKSSRSPKGRHKTKNLVASEKEKKDGARFRPGGPPWISKVKKKKVQALNRPALIQEENVTGAP